MRMTLNNGKAMKALALSFATAAIFSATASGEPTAELQVQTSPDSVLAEVPSDYAADWLDWSGAGDVAVMLLLASVLLLRPEGLAPKVAH